jgi:hypothetical protein
MSIEPSMLSLVPVGNAVYAPPIQIYVPIAVTPDFRLEPAFGLTSVNDKGTGYDLVSDAYSLGLGALYVRPVAPQVQVLAGGRFTAVWSRDERPDTGAAQPGILEARQRSFVLAVVLGGEYLPSPWFSVGFEAQFAYALLGDIDVTLHSPAPATSTLKGGSATSTNALVFLRVYVL